MSTSEKPGRTTPKKPKKESAGVTDVSSWKKKSGAGELELPSGNVCLAIRPGVMTFVRQGIVPNSLMGIMNKAAEGQLPDKDLQKGLGEIVENPQKMQDMLQMVDAITLHCVVEPKVYPVPGPTERRDPALLYVDEVEDDDKMFIFTWAVGGDRSLERFREQQGAMLESLPAGKDVERPAKRASRAPKK